jgi:hypothetical protein
LYPYDGVEIFQLISRSARSVKAAQRLSLNRRGCCFFASAARNSGLSEKDRYLT